MTRPFELWDDRIAAAADEEARRALLAELGQWRAAHLGDVAATRRATFAMSRLYGLLGARDQAVSEARQLLSLCRTAPEAPDEEVQAAVGWLRALGETPPPLPPRPRRDRFERDRFERDRGPRERPRERPPAGRPARQEASAPARREAAAPPRGAAAMVVRAHAEIVRALEGPEHERVARLESLRDELARAAGIGRPAEPPAGDDPLSLLLGARIPGARAARIRMIESWADAHPDRIDTLAATALRSQVAQHGPRSAAPWLVGITGRALAAGAAQQTRAAIAELQAHGALVVEAYDEWAFERLVRLLVRAGQVGHAFVSLRRGVVARGEPDDRKVWTLRLKEGGIERMFAVSPHATTPAPEGQPAEIALRLVSLCPRTALLATGSGNDALRREAHALGIVVLEHDADDDALLAALVAASPRTAPPVAHDVSVEPPPGRLGDILGSEPLDEEALATFVASFRRPDRLLRAAQRLDPDDARTAALLRAIDRNIEPGRPLPEATTLALRTAAAGGDVTRALLVEPGSGSERFGGPGIDVVVDVARALAADGWLVHRVLRGATRREQDVHSALEPLAPHLSGLWRLLVRRGDIRGEVWVVAQLPPEAQAAIPILLLEPWQRVVIVPAAVGELAAAYRATGPAPIAWTGTEGDALRAAVGAFVVREAPAEEPEARP